MVIIYYVVLFILNLIINKLTCILYTSYIFNFNFSNNCIPFLNSCYACSVNKIRIEEY